MWGTFTMRKGGIVYESAKSTFLFLGLEEEPCCFSVSDVLDGWLAIGNDVRFSVGQHNF